MRSIATTTLIAVLALAHAGVAVAQQSDVPVVSTIADADPATAPALQIRSDGLGPYVNKTRYLSSVVQAIGDWELDLGMIVRGNGRTVFVGFDQPIPGTGPSGDPVAPPSQQYVLRFITKCWSVSQNLWLLAPGQSVTCPLFIPFNDSAGTKYRIQMGRSVSPTSDDALITCLARGSDGKCARWHVGPSGAYVGPEGSVVHANIGTLVKLTTKKGAEVQLPQGDFRFAFSIDVTR